MVRFIYLLFGLAAYVVFLGTFLYLIGFVANFSQLPRTVDFPPTRQAWPFAAALDLLLISIFGLQHSLMARSGFKARWRRFVPEPIERSGYVLLASVALILLFLYWQPINESVWDLRGTLAAPVLWALFAAGWLIVLVSTFLISHFELFGLTQVWNSMRRKTPAAPMLRQPFFYKMVRHPLYSGFFLAFWATPAMTYGHLLLALGMSLYMLVAIEFEERDLVRLFGKDYVDYRAKVGKLAPRFGRPRRGAVNPGAAARPRS